MGAMSKDRIKDRTRDRIGRVGVQELLELGVQARRRADHGAALEHFQKAVAAYPKNIRAKLETGRTLVRLSRTGEAEAIIRGALADEPDHVPALLTLGQMLADSDRLAEAETTLQRANELAPDHPKALRALVSLLYRRDADRARAMFAAAAEAGRVSPAARV